MRSLQLETAVDLSSGGNGSERAMDADTRDHPFVTNNSAVFVLSSQGLADTELKLQGWNNEDDGWVDLEDENGDSVLIDADGVLHFTAEIPEKLRTVVTAGSSAAGTANVALLTN